MNSSAFSPQVRLSGFRNREIFFWYNTEFSVLGIQNPANDCNPESKFHWLGVRNPVHGIRSPRLSHLSYVILITGVLDCQFHPTQPWIFTAGADHLIRLYTWHTLPVLWPSRQHDGLVLCKLLSPGPGDELVLHVEWSPFFNEADFKAFGCHVGGINYFGEILPDQRRQPEALLVEGRVCKTLCVRISKKDLAGKVTFTLRANKLDWRRFSHLNVGSYKLQPIRGVTI